MGIILLGIIREFAHFSHITPIRREIFYARTRPAGSFLYNLSSLRVPHIVIIMSRLITLFNLLFRPFWEALIDSYLREVSIATNSVAFSHWSHDSLWRRVNIERGNQRSDANPALLEHIPCSGSHRCSEGCRISCNLRLVSYLLRSSGGISFWGRPLVFTSPAFSPTH